MKHIPINITILIPYYCREYFKYNWGLLGNNAASFNFSIKNYRFIFTYLSYDAVKLDNNHFIGTYREFSIIYKIKNKNDIAKFILNHRNKLLMELE